MLEFIIYGLIHEGDWDLTQPQATLLAGVISGVLLIVAAYIAFHGQREQRREEGRRHRELVEAQKEQFDEQLQIQREGWRVEHKAVSDRLYRDEVRDTYRRTIAISHSIHNAMFKIEVMRKHETHKKEILELNDKLQVDLETYMLVEAELAMIDAPDVHAAHNALAEMVSANGDAIWPQPDAKGSEVAFDKSTPRRLIKELTEAMRIHLELLRPNTDH